MVRLRKNFALDLVDADFTNKQIKPYIRYNLIARTWVILKNSLKDQTTDHIWAFLTEFSHQEEVVWKK